MKKFAFCICLAAAVFINISSCKKVEEEEVAVVVKQPDITVKDTFIQLSLATGENLKYINIFRKELVDEGETEPEAVNIGEIIPTSKDVKSAYTFYDYYIVSNKKYTYQAKYTFSDKTEKTGWTTWPKKANNEDVAGPVTPYTSNEDLAYAVPTESYFEYDSDAQSLCLKGASIPYSAAYYPDSENDTTYEIERKKGFRPALVLTNDSKTRPFIISGDTVPDDTSFKIEDTENNVSATKFFLRNLVTQDFYDKKITVKGIIYEKTDVSDSSYTVVYWSQLSEITIKDSEDAAVEYITIPFSTVSDNYHDFTTISSKRYFFQ